MPTLSLRQLVFGITVGMLFAVLQGDLRIPVLAKIGIHFTAPAAHRG
jgi:hypothetical protein